MSPEPGSVRSLTIRLLVFVTVALTSFLLINGIYALGPGSQESSHQERKLKTKDFKDMPLELVEVRNLQSESWYEDIEIELKNISGKSIYFLTAYLVFPDEKLDWGEAGIRLSWGESKKLDAQKVAEPDAPHVKPGQTFVITISKVYMKGLRAQQRLRPEKTKNLLIRFEKTYFGDGTGAEVENWWRDYRGKDPPRKSRIRDISPPIPIDKEVSGSYNE